MSVGSLGSNGDVTVVNSAATMVSDGFVYVSIASHDNNGLAGGGVSGPRLVSDGVDVGVVSVTSHGNDNGATAIASHGNDNGATAIASHGNDNGVTAIASHGNDNGATAISAIILRKEGVTTVTAGKSAHDSIQQHISTMQSGISPSDREDKEGSEVDHRDIATLHNVVPQWSRPQRSLKRWM